MILRLLWTGSRVCYAHALVTLLHLLVRRCTAVGKALLLGGFRQAANVTGIKKLKEGNVEKDQLLSGTRIRIKYDSTVALSLQQYDA